MVKRNDTSKRRTDRHQPASTARNRPASTDNPDALSSALLQSPLVQAIEAERAQLLEAHAVLRCLYEVLLYGNDDEAVLHAEAAHAAARLIDESVARLDIVRLAPMIEAIKLRGDYEYEEEKLDAGLNRNSHLRDSAPPQYLC